MSPSIERRACPRFSLQEATVSYRRIGLLRRKADWTERSCLVVDLSRGGVRFLTRQRPPLGSQIHIELIWPEGPEALTLTGRVRWIGKYTGDQFQHSVGVQFAPYGQGKKYNPVQALDTIIGLENKNAK